MSRRRKIFGLLPGEVFDPMAPPRKSDLTPSYLHQRVLLPILSFALPPPLFAPLPARHTLAHHSSLPIQPLNSSAIAATSMKRETESAQPATARDSTGPRLSTRVGTFTEHRLVRAPRNGRQCHVLAFDVGHNGETTATTLDIQCLFLVTRQHRTKQHRLWF